MKKRLLFGENLSKTSIRIVGSGIRIRYLSKASELDIIVKVFYLILLQCYLFSFNNFIIFIKMCLKQIKKQFVLLEEIFLALFIQIVFKFFLNRFSSANFFLFFFFNRCLSNSSRNFFYFAIFLGFFSSNHCFFRFFNTVFSFSNFFLCSSYSNSSFFVFLQYASAFVSFNFVVYSSFSRKFLFLKNLLLLFLFFQLTSFNFF